VAERAFNNTPQADRSRPALDDVKALAAQVVAQGSAALAKRVVDELPPGKRVLALSRAVDELVQYDVAGAQRLLEQIAATQKPATDDSGRRSLNEDPEFAFGLAAKSVIAALAETNPPAALALARRVQSSSHRSMALALAAAAQPEPLGSAVFSEAMTVAKASGYDARDVTPQIAVMTHHKNAALGVQMLNELKARLSGDRNNPEPGAVSLADFAFHYARVDPAESRLLLEQEWVRQMQSRGAGGGDWGPADLPLAMTAVDLERALEMARALPNDNARFDVQRKIAQYVVASDEVRRTMPFNRWSASDTWAPGTPTQW
jgi:hypothetical protein